MKIEEYGQLLKFELKSNVFVLEVNGYNVYLKEWQYVIMNIPSFYISVDKEITKEELKRLEQAALNNACALSTVSNKNDTLIITLPEVKRDQEKFVENCNNILSRVTKLLKLDGFNNLSLCPVCHKEALYDNFMGSYIPLHLECKEKVKNNLLKKIEEEKGFKWSYVLAIFMSLAMGVIGLLPSFFLAIYKFDYFTPLIVLCPILMVSGLFISRAPLKKWLKIIIWICCVGLIVAFDIYTLPIMARGRNLAFKDYIFGNGWVGFRKILFTSIFALGCLGMMKFISKFRPNYQEQLNKM